MAMPELMMPDLEEGLLLQEPPAMVVQETRQQEITEVLPMHHKTPEIPQVLQRVAQPMREQPVPPGDLSFKQRWKLKSLDKKAQKKNKYADHVSIAIEEQMDNYRKERLVELERLQERQIREEGRGEDFDERIIWAFITGYKADDQGNPLNEQENEKKLRDEKLLEDYNSRDLKRRQPHLERIKNEILNMRISSDMLSDAYMEKHASEVYDMIAKLTYFQNIHEDAVNAPYFDKLPDYEKEMLNYRDRGLCGAFQVAWSHALLHKGFNSNGSTLKYMNAQDVEECQFKLQETPLRMELFRNQVDELERKEEALRQKVQRQAMQPEILRFNEAVGNSMPEPALDKAIGSEADYESLKSLFHEEIHEEVRNHQTFQCKGLVELSDRALEEGGESAALQAFQIRESSKEAAQRDKKLRGQFFLDIPKDYAQMFRSLHDAGVNFEAMNAAFKKTSCGMGAYCSGGGIEQIHDKMLAHFRKYIEAPQGQEYVGKMVSILENAKVFAGQREKCVNFIFQCLLNSYGANYTGVGADKAYYKQQAEAAVSVCRESCRNLLSLPRLTQFSEEEKAKLPPEIRELEKQYSELIRKTCGK